MTARRSDVTTLDLWPSKVGYTVTGMKFCDFSLMVKEIHKRDEQESDRRRTDAISSSSSNCMSGTAYVLLCSLRNATGVQEA